MRGRGAIIFLAAAMAGLVPAPVAQATVLMTPQVEFATSPITVGASGNGTLAFTNDSTAGEQALFIERIVLEPSCRLSGDTPPCEDREPNIFSISNGTGVTGTACAGITFTNTPGTAPFVGSREFTQQTPIPAMPVNATCAINFTYTALGVPTEDTQPGEPGIDTDQNAIVRPDFGGGPQIFGPATDFTAVSPAPPVTTPPVLTPTPLVTTPVATPPKCRKGQKLKKGKCVRKRKKK